MTALLLTAAAPAQAQFGFSWFGGPPQPMVRVIPDQPRLRPARLEPRVRPGSVELEARRRARAEYEREAAKKDPSKPSIVGPLIIVVSVNRQRLTVYDGDQAIASSPVSTGKEGHETPYGVFSVIQKEILHHSNLYDDAPMPYMQRITWSGVALHAGPLPGHAASHGCIRLPREFAVRLWGMTKVGARVIVARDELTPVEFSDPHLFTMRQDTPGAPTATAPAAEGGAALDAAQSPTDAATDRTRAAGQLASLANVPVLHADDVAGPAPGERSEESHAAANVAAADLPAPSVYAEMAPTAEEIAQAAESEREKSARARATAAATTDPNGAESSPAVTDQMSRPASGAVGALAPNGEMKGDSKPGASPPSETPVMVKPARPKKAGPISIFVSRKEKKLFVRRGFEPVLDAPISFEGDQPLGTHVYTAINRPAEGNMMRWVELSITNPDVAEAEMHRDRLRSGRIRGGTQTEAPVPVSWANASQALERVQVSSELRDRIADMITPGSSLIISDKGLGNETGRGTDFIVLTH